MTAKQTPISIRPAREDDCSRVAEIGARAWKAIYDGYRAQLGPELFDTFYPEAIRHKCCSLREEMQTLPFFVAEVDGSVVAFAACRISGTEGELMDNAVDPGLYRARDREQSASLCAELSAHARLYPRRCADGT